MSNYEKHIQELAEKYPKHIHLVQNEPRLERFNVKEYNDRMKKAKDFSFTHIRQNKRSNSFTGTSLTGTSLTGTTRTATDTTLVPIRSPPPSKRSKSLMELLLGNNE